MIRRRIAASMVAISVFSLLPPSGPRGEAAGPIPSVADPSHRVYMMTDSVGLGAKGAVPAAMPDFQVTVDGQPALFVEQLESKFLRSRMATSPDVLGDIAVIAGGYNYPYWDPDRFDRSIDHMMATLREAGVQHVVWVTLREVDEQYVSASAWRDVQPYYWYFPTVNEHLRRALARHPDLSLADWAAIAHQRGITYDAIHLNTAGAALYAGLIANVVRTAATRLEQATTTKITVAGLNGVPADAAAVAVNLTVTTPRIDGFLAVYPCGIERPATSNLNFTADQTVAVAAIVTVGTDGQICVFVSQRTHVIVDVAGYFAAGSGYSPVTPVRLADTREPAGSPVHSAGVSLVVPVAGVGSIPVDAAAVAVNVTIVDSMLAGYATAYPCDDPPPQPIALVNFIPHTATPNFTVTKPAADGTLCIATNVPASIIVDAFGYFPADGSIIVSPPLRLADTRSGAPLAPGDELQVPVIGQSALPAGAAAVVLGVTAASPLGVGYVTAHPCGSVTPASTLNVVPARNTSNTAIAGAGTGGSICVTSNTTLHVLVDATAWVVDGFTGLTPWRAFDSRAA